MIQRINLGGVFNGPRLGAPWGHCLPHHLPLLFGGDAIDVDGGGVKHRRQCRTIPKGPRFLPSN